MADLISFRDLNADEIECRVSQFSEKRIILLLYKNARCDMAILDETVGSENWQRAHYECHGSLYCNVGINVDYNRIPKDPSYPRLESWVWKSDCGTCASDERSGSRKVGTQEKGEASDSFKRACVCWGCGRELYTAPKIIVFPTDKSGEENYRIVTKYGGEKTTYDEFFVEKISILNKKIVGLAIRNRPLDKRVFTWTAENDSAV